MIKFDAPLGVPQGSIRAVLALVVICTASATIFIGTVSESSQTFIFGLAGVAFGYYFGSRGSETAQTPSSGEPLPTVGTSPAEPEEDLTPDIVPG